MKKRLLSLLLAALMLAGIMTVGVSAADELPFDDVNEEHWFYPYVEYVYENGLMQGTGDRKFDPNVNMNRAMFVTILGRLDGAEEKETDAFSDVESGQWYSGYVGWASENEVFSGYPDGTFRPMDPITREQMSTALTNYLEYTGKEPLKDAHAPAGFADAEAIADWAKPYVDNMRILGLVKGNQYGEFDPKGTLTRAQAATLLQRMNEMFDYLALEEAIVPDYRPEGKDFHLLGAYQLYYSGTALTTSYKGTEVNTEGDIPLLVNDPDGRKFSHFYLDPVNTVANGNYYGFDLKIACIDPNEYPIARIGYLSDSGMAATVSVYSGDLSRESFNAVPGNADGLDTLTVNLTEGGEWADSAEEIVLTVCSTQGTELEIAYIAFFKTAEEADAFSAAEYKDHFSSYAGEDVFYEKIDKDTLDGILAEADKISDAIINSEDDIDPETVTGTVYYISSVNGNDSNDGLTPETAWKSIDKLSYFVAGGTIEKTILVAGDCVLFERGSKFYPTKTTTNSGSYHGGFGEGVIYGAYGEGPKPVFTTAVEYTDGSNKGTWSKTDAPDVYVLDQVLEVPEGSAAHYNDIANIVFNRGEAWGIKVIVSGEAGTVQTTNKSGWVTNGIDYYYEGGTVFEGYKSLTNNLEYWLDYETQKVYLCSKAGNPGEIFGDIVITKMGSGMYAGGENILVDNLAFYGIGTHAIDAAEVVNFKVQNCTFEWIGGAGTGTRLGNAIQNWGSCDGFFVVDCYIDQVYDAGITTQGGDGMMMNNEYSGNVIKNCNMSIELFNGVEDSCMTNIIARDNYILYSGFGFGHQRPQGNMTGSAFLGGKGWNTPTSNVVFENNYNIYSALFAFGSAGMARGEKAEGIIMRNNVYLMDPDTGYCARSVNNMIENYGHNKTLLPYTEQYIQYLSDIGINRGTKYYYYDGYLFPEEEYGVFYDYYEYVK